MFIINPFKSDKEINKKVCIAARLGLLVQLGQTVRKQFEN